MDYWINVEITGIKDYYLDLAKSGLRLLGFALLELYHFTGVAHVTTAIQD